jgi:hypothetical protein
MVENRSGWTETILKTKNYGIFRFHDDKEFFRHIEIGIEGHGIYIGYHIGEIFIGKLIKSYPKPETVTLKAIMSGLDADTNEEFITKDQDYEVIKLEGGIDVKLGVNKLIFLTWEEGKHLFGITKNN